MNSWSPIARDKNCVVMTGKNEQWTLKRNDNHLDHALGMAMAKKQLEESLWGQLLLCLQEINFWLNKLKNISLMVHHLWVIHSLWSAQNRRASLTQVCKRDYLVVHSSYQCTKASVFYKFSPTLGNVNLLTFYQPTQEV